MSDLTFGGLDARKTTRATDVTGPDNLLLLLPNPGDEIGYAGLIAELCARGRPPFVAVLADGAADGSHILANARERASRAAMTVLGMPEDRVLFVGLREGRLPQVHQPLFEPLKEAMILLSWRKDCNVVGASDPVPGDDDGLATWQVADAIVREVELPLVVGAPRQPLAGSRSQSLWELDVTAWAQVRATAALRHGGARSERSGAADQRFLRVA